jgi:hypothetical protein
MKASTLARLLRTFDRPGNDMCWLWKNAPATNGYGQFFIDGKRRAAHRVVYELLLGPVPVGLVLDHLCRVRLCVNPHHLEPVTDEENIDRSPVHNGAKTHCKRGHDFTTANTYLQPSGGRRCRTCAAESESKRPARSHHFFRPDGGPADDTGCPGTPVVVPTSMPGIT